MSLNNLSAINIPIALIDAGDFVMNKRIVSNNQILYYTDPLTGIKCGYVWKGTLPHVTSTNNPETDGGISSTAWMPIIYSSLKEKLNFEGITLTWQAHLPTVEVAYGLTRNSLHKWESGKVATSNDYWLYSDGTVWNGEGILGSSPNLSSGFTQITPNFNNNNNITTYSVSATSGQTIFNIPYTFTTITVYVNGSLQVPGINYNINNSTLTFTTELENDDLVYVFLGTQNINENDKINRIYTATASNKQTTIQIPYDFSTALLYINGVLQNPTYAYTIGADKIVTFSEPLYEGDDILILIGDVVIQNNEFLLKSDLSDSNGASIINTSTGISVQSTLDIINQRVGKSVNIFDYMTSEQLSDIKLASPILDHSDAFNRAKAVSNFIILPPVIGWYNFGDIELPDIFRIDGSSTNTYTAATSAAINTMGSSIKRFGTYSCVFKFNRYVVFNNINIYGNGNPWMLKRTSSADIQRIVFNDCGLYGSTYGIGLSSGYCKEVDCINCHIANNSLAGWRNTIDSKMIGGYINANGGGVQCMTGANDNTFIGVKNEWNSGIAWEFYGATSNNIIGGITDRSGNSGLSLKNGSRCTVTGGVWRRNGKDILGTRACSHFYVEGANNQLIVSSIDTRTGANDDGTGDTTPNYVVTTGGSDTSNSIIITSSALGGFVTSGYSFSPTPTNVRIESNLFSDDYVNTGFYRKSNGLSYTSFSGSQVAATSTNTYTLAHPTMSEYSVVKRKIVINARNTSAGTFASSEFDILITRNAASSSSSIQVISGTEINTGTNIGTTGTSLQIKVPTIDVDGTTISLDIQNLSAVTFSIQTYLK